MRPVCMGAVLVLLCAAALEAGPLSRAEAVKRALAEDAEDLEAFETRRDEPSVDFEAFLKNLKRRGKI